MARKIQDIYNAFVASIVSAGASVGLTITPSQWSIYDYKRLLLNTVATGQSVLEQLWDSKKSDIEAVVSIMSPQTNAWWQYNMINVFQFDTTNPQILQLNTDPSSISFYYPVQNDAYKIIDFTSVNPSPFGLTTIKVAGAGPAPLTTTQLNAAQAFVNLLAVDGINYKVVSKASDKLFMQLNVYYNGLYSAVIQNNVISAIDNYLANIPFDGLLTILDLQIAIRNLDGVNDVTFDNVRARINSASVTTGTNIILNKTEVNRNYQTVAGYIVKESTTGANVQLTDFRVGSSGIHNLNLIAQ